jgi:hypothetical protein
MEDKMDTIKRLRAELVELGGSLDETVEHTLRVFASYEAPGRNNQGRTSIYTSPVLGDDDEDLRGNRSVREDILLGYVAKGAPIPHDVWDED